MPRKKNEFNPDDFSSQLEEMAATPKPAPIREDSELVKRVRQYYDTLKQAIVQSGWSYADVSELFARTGLKKGASPPSVKAALMKVAEERGEVWDYQRKSTQIVQNDDQEELTEASNLSQSPKSTKGKFVDMPEAL